VRSDGSRERHHVPLAGSPCTTPEGYLAPGVVHLATTDPSGPFAINVVTVDLAAPSKIDVALALDVLPGQETTSSMARRRGATVAVNGDYVDPAGAGRPIHAFAWDGRLLQTPGILGNNHAVDDRETAVFMGRPIVQVVAEVPATGVTLAVQQSTGGAGRRRGGAETAYAVEAVGPLGGPVPTGTVVLSTPATGAHAPDLAALEPGDQVTVAWSFAAWPGILETSGGNPTLVRNGRVLSGNVDGTTPFHRRNPRTAVGATGDGKLLIVTVDGRQPGHSVGMSLRELAELFVRLGARSAMNLDGGSTTMVIDGTIVNRVSDPQERRVPSALLVLREPAPAVPPAAAALAPEAEAVAQRADLDAAAADPGSTAGLLEWLAAQDAG